MHICLTKRVFMNKGKANVIFKAVGNEGRECYIMKFQTLNIHIYKIKDIFLLYSFSTTICLRQSTNTDLVANIQISHFTRNILDSSKRC